MFYIQDMNSVEQESFIYVGVLYRTLTKIRSLPTVKYAECDSVSMIQRHHCTIFTAVFYLCRLYLLQELPPLDTVSKLQASV